MKVFPVLGRTLLYLVLLFPLSIHAQNVNQLYINEINYRAIEPLENIDFIELYNAGTQSVDLSGWFLTGGLKYTFPAGSNIASGAYLLIAADPALVQSTFGISGALGPWEGKLASSSDKVVLRTADYEVIDRVDYENWKEWPNVRYLDTETTKVAVSIQKLNPLLGGNNPGSWVADVPTPKTQNTGVYLPVATDIPVLKDVSKSPDKPMTNEAVRVKADFAGAVNYASGMTVTLEYQINNAGSYVAKSEMGTATWQTAPMLDNGIGADSTANNGIYTGLIPANVQVDRRLIRYRIKITKNGTNRYFPDPNHRESNYSYFVYDGHANFGSYNFAALDTINEFTVITNDVIPTTGVSGVYNTEATLIYNGKIYDHITFRGRGTSARPKPNFKFKFNSEKKLKLEDDCGKDYDVAKSKISLSGGYVNDPASHGFTESLIYKILDLVGALPRHADYTQLRIIDSATEIGSDGDFWGLYIMLEDYNSEDYFEENGLATGNIWGHKPDEMKHAGEFPNAINIPPPSELNTTPAVNYDWDLVIADRVANVIYGQNGNNYFGKHSHLDYYNSETATYHTWWSDMDNAFGSTIDDDNWFLRTNSNVTVGPVNGTCRPAGTCIELTPNTIDYKNELRSAYDLLLNAEQANFLVDMESKHIYDPSQSTNWTDLDDARWGTLVTNYYYNPNNNNLPNMVNQLNWYKNEWFSDRAAVILGRNTDGLVDGAIPNKPTISNTGTTALDNLTFSNSPFFDPQGAGTFGALEWRVGEWSDPSNPYYDTKCKPKYEIETKWSSGELAYSNTFQIPPEANLKAGRTYKIRVRYKDTSGRWSHWSNAQTVVPTPAPTANCNLVINEIMYNPAERYTEFIEIHNIGPSTISLDNFKMTEGVDFDFPIGSSILADEYIILAEDSCEFFNIHGFYPFGEYSASLSDGGEYLELSGPYGAICDSLTFDDGNSWPAAADNGFYSLAFQEEQIDNAIPSNWGIQPLLQTPGQQNDLINFGQHAYSGIVINEIHYNPFDDPVTGDLGKKFEFIELKNIGTTAINLTGVFFSLGIDYYFPDNTIMNPGDFIVLAEDKSSFEDRYGFAPFDKYDGALSDEGETILLNDKNDILLDAVTYGVAFPWDGGANGGAADKSLALIDGNYNNETRLNWKTQCNNVLYTPGAENEFSCFAGLGLDGLTITEFSYTPNTTEFIEIQNNSSSPYNLEEVKLSSAVTYNFSNKWLAPGQFVVLANDAALFTTNYGITPDGEYSGGLSSNGETILLKDLFGVTLDSVSYGVASPWNTEPTLGIKSLALIDSDLDNSLPESWCIQDVNVSPKALNTFSNTDGDSVVDCLDSCPNLNNNLIGTACNDNNSCTIGETYDANCGCSGGVAQDSDSDGVCDADDICPGHDDNIDTDNNGIPDGCDGCDTNITEMNFPIIMTDKKASNNITTNGKVPSVSTIDYHAGSNVDMLSGFEVELGAVYHAYIKPCN